MFGQGLSLDQAPPFFSPFRFFITAPLFGIAAGIVLMLTDAPLLENRLSGPFLGAVHLVTLGTVLMVMMGAMQQMLPVIAGVQFRAPLSNARWIHALLSLGVVLFFSGFFFEKPWVLAAGIVFLVAAIFYFILIVAGGLLRVESRSDSVRAFGYAVASLVIAIALGAWEGFAYSGIVAYSGVLASLHIHWIFFGWILLLIIGVSFQVIPMFYVTHSYPPFCRRRGVPLIFGSLVVMSASGLIGWHTVWIVPAAHLTVVLLAGGYAVVTVGRLRNRKRAVKDTNVAFWYVAMGSLIVGVTVWFTGEHLIQSEGIRLGASVLLGAGFVLSVLNAMLYKIVPFLVWFHLTSQGHFGVPTMRELIAERRIRFHFYLHMAALIGLMLSVTISPLLFHPSGLLFALAYGLLGWNLATAGRVYWLKSKEKAPSMDFDMESFTKKV